jgi:hypothetical protein
MSNTWEQLSLYESTELVGRFYQERHGVSSSAEKKHAIAAYMAQGRQYFQSARDASDLVKPLLLFYGANAMAKCAILFLDGTPDALDLMPAHGLSQSKWESILQQGLPHLLDISASVKDGTFNQLVARTKNRERLRIPVDSPVSDFPTEQQEVVTSGASAFPRQAVLPLREVLSRIPGLTTVYERTLNIRANCYKTA